MLNRLKYSVSTFLLVSSSVFAVPVVAGPPSVDITSSSTTISESDGWSGYRTLIVGDNEFVSSVDVTYTNLGTGYLHTNISGSSSWHQDWYTDGGELLDFGLDETIESGTYSFDWRESDSQLFSVRFIFKNKLNLAPGRLVGSVSQTQIQNSSFLLQSLGQQVRHLNSGGNRSSNGGMPFAASSAPTSLGGGEIQLVGYQSASTIDLVDYRSGSASPLRWQTGQTASSGWDGWMHSYGMGGQIDGHQGVSGLDYGAGGTQFGMYNAADAATLVGVFGAYSFQNADIDDGSEANVNSGMLGAFIRRGDNSGNYYILASSVTYDDYDTSRTGGVSGTFDGMQTGTYLERGLTRRGKRLTFQPSAALQYIWVHQDDHTESGPGGVTINDVDAYSLRSVVGASFQTSKQLHGPLGFSWAPSMRAHWMHEYLDTSTSVAGSQAGAAFVVDGLDLGRDWAIVGMGIGGSRSSAFSLYANYDLQINDRQQWHTCSGGVVCRR